MFYQLLFQNSNNFLSADLQDITTLLFKILFLIAAFLYFLFSIVVIRQISTMRSTLITEFSPILTTISYLHLAASLAVLFFFVISL